MNVILLWAQDLCVTSSQLRTRTGGLIQRLPVLQQEAWFHNSFAPGHVGCCTKHMWPPSSQTKLSSLLSDTLRFFRKIKCKLGIFLSLLKIVTLWHNRVSTRSDKETATQTYLLEGRSLSASEACSSGNRKKCLACWKYSSPFFRSNPKWHWSYLAFA